jgi:tetratricopeptide (TPR) repeat protein
VPDDAWDRQLASGRELASQGRYLEARKVLEQARREAEQFGATDNRLAIALNNLGAVHLHLNDVAEAERCYRLSASIWERRGDAVNTLAPVTNLAGVYLARRQYTAADNLLRHALELATDKLGTEHPQVAVILSYLSDVALAERDLESASSLSERALAVVRHNHPAPDPDLALALDNLGTLYRAQKRLEDAARLYMEAVHVLEAVGRPEHPAWIRAFNGWSAVYFDQGRYEEARKPLQQSLALAEKTLGPNHPDLVRILRDYAAVLRKTRHKGEAKKLEVRAAQIMDQTGRDNGIGYTVDRRTLSGFR